MNTRTPALRAKFRQLAKVEPQLQLLLDHVERIHAADTLQQPQRFCANAHWYGHGLVAPADSIRRELIRLVGWEARAPELRTMQAYDIAYEYLYSRLPDCRNCGCS